MEPPQGRPSAARARGPNRWAAGELPVLRPLQRGSGWAAGEVPVLRPLQRGSGWAAGEVPVLRPLQRGSGVRP